MWFTDPGLHDMGSASAAGVISRYTQGLNPGANPSQLAVGSDGEVWFTDEGTTPAIGVVNQSGQITEYSNGLTGQPGQLVLGPNGNLWFTETGPAGIGEITPQGQITTFSNGLGAGSEPYALISGPDNTLWFTDQGAQPAIAKITTSGTITEYEGLPTGSQPTAMAFGADGNLWFTDSGTGAVGETTPSGQSTEYPVTSGPKAKPYVLEAGPDGNLWFTDPGDGAVGRVVTPVVAPTAQSPIPTTLVAAVTAKSPHYGTKLGYRAEAFTPSGRPTGGTVTFSVGRLTLCRAPLAQGTAECRSALAPGAGAATLEAVYSGTTVYRPSDARTLVRILPAYVRVTAGRVLSGRAAYRYTATVTARPPATGTPQGTVRFGQGPRLICQAHLAHGRAACLSSRHPVTYEAVFSPTGRDFAAGTVRVHT
jgi:streptogramin lyase